MERAAPDEERAEEHSEPVQATPAPGALEFASKPDTMLALQRTRGNAYVSRLATAAPQVSRFASPDAATIARRKPQRAPSAQESVGADPSQATFLPGTTGQENDTIGVGEHGFTLQMLKEVPAKAGAEFGNYAGAHLHTVKPSFNTLDNKILPEIAKKKRHADDEADSFFNTPSTTKTWQDRSASHDKDMKQLATDRATEQRLAQDFNTGVPRANQTFMSLAKLESMQDMLGVKNPKAMSEAVVKSLKEAQEIGERVQVKKGVTSMTPPKADEQVTVAAQEMSQAQREMQTSWMGVQQLLIKDHVAEIKQKGEKDEARLKDIKETIGFARKVGGTIDLAMTVMSGGETMIEGAASKPLTPSQMMDLMASEKPNLMDTSGAGAAKTVGKAIAKEMGIEIPTSAAGLLETAAKIYYSFEMEEIRKRLVELNIQMDAHKAAADQIGLKQIVKTFDDKCKNFQLKASRLQKASLDRQLAYLSLGEQLDKEARADAKSKGSAPGAGKERFATVMAVTSAVREVLAMAEGAKEGFGMDSKSAKTQLYAVLDNRRPYKFPEEEDKPMGDLLSQLQHFERNVETLKEDLGPIDAQAGTMMKALSAGHEEAAAY